MVWNNFRDSGTSTLIALGLVVITLEVVMTSVYNMQFSYDSFVYLWLSAYNMHIAAKNVLDIKRMKF